MSFIPTVSSGITWDPSRLQSDELEIECLVRNIDTAQSDAALKLADMWQKEEKGTIGRPVRMHSSLVIPQDELEICNTKIRRLILEVDQVSQSAGQDMLPTLALRVYHICSRLVRLSSNYPEYEEDAGKILIGCQKLAGRLMELRSDELNRSRDVAAGVSLPTSHTDDTTKQGAIPKSTQVPKPKKINKRRGNVSSINNTGLSSHSNPISEKSPISYSESITRPVGRPNWQPRQQYVPLHNPIRVPQRQYIADFQNEVIDNAAVNVPHRAGYVTQQHPVKTIDKWQIKYSGAENDMAVDEFVFRAETIARSTNTSLNSLVNGINFLLTGKAATWYWIHIRTFPHQNWQQFKSALLERFSVEETDAEIRMLVENRKQLARESFGDFALAVQQLLVRLRRPVGGEETVEILRRNMSQRLKEALLLHHTRTVDQLHSLCRRFEKLWSQHSLPRLERRINEMGLDEACQYGHPYENMDELAALGKYSICWNCKEMGHGFQDCTSNIRSVFCYGCGTPDTYKPTCRKCTGNGQRHPRVVGPRIPNILPNHGRDQNQDHPPNP